MKISVILPTHRRGNLLRSALASIANQSKPDLIAEVIVSENSDDDSSRRITSEFRGLPIRYIVRQPPVDIGEHFSRLIEETTAPYVACLGDDDMWGRYHLEQAYRSLAKHAEAVAYSAQDLVINHDARVLAAVGHHCMLTCAFLSDTREAFADCWIADRLQMTAACLAGTPLNMWGLVGRRDPLISAFQTFAEPSLGYDADRYMIWALAGLGPILIGAEIGLFYRKHLRNTLDQMLGGDAPRQRRLSAEYTRRMILDAEHHGLPLRDAWINAIQSMTPTERERYWSLASHGAKEVLAQAWPDSVERLFACRQRFLKAAVRDLFPPFLWKSMAGLKKTISRRLGPRRG